MVLRKVFSYKTITTHNAPEGAIAGTLSGVVLGAPVGWFCGAGDWTLPGLLTLVNVGPITSALMVSGALGLTGALLGGIFGRVLTHTRVVRRLVHVVGQGPRLISFKPQNVLNLHPSGTQDISSVTTAPKETPHSLKTDAQPRLGLGRSGFIH